MRRRRRDLRRMRSWQSRAASARARSVCQAPPKPAGTGAAVPRHVAPAGKKPRTYDDIVRETVVDPDSSVRPTREQEQAAREGFRAMDAYEQALRDRVERALVSTVVGATDVTIEVARDLVTLRGRVPDTAMLRSVEEAVSRVAGVEAIHSLLVVDPEAFAPEVRAP